MRVLLIATYEGMSGASYSLLGMLENYKKMGLYPYVILIKHGEMETYLEEYGIPYKIIRGFVWVSPLTTKITIKQRFIRKIKEILNWVADLRIAYFIKKNQIELLHINAFTADVGYCAARLTNVKCVWHIREFVEEDLGKKHWNEKKALKELEHADKVIAISQSVKDKFSSKVPKADITVVYNGISTDEYIKKRVNAPFEKDEVTITIAGRIDKGKGHEELLKAMYLLKQEGVNNLKLQIVGVGQNDGFVDSLKNYIIEKDLSDCITFLGYRKDVSTIFKNSDIVVVASKAEAFGRVTVEAMMAGALVIGADTAGTKELIKTLYGLLYQQGSSISLAKIIRYALENKKEMQIIASEARNYALHNFTAEQNAKKMVKVYKTLLKG